MSEGYRQECLKEHGEECHLCGTTEDVVVHHRDGDRTNNSIDNLIPLCRKHHSQIHHGSDEILKLVTEAPNSGTNYASDLRPTTIRLTDETLEKLDLIAQTESSDRSTIIREVLRALASGSRPERVQNLEYDENQEVKVEQSDSSEFLRELVKSQQKVIEQLSKGV